MAKSRYKIETPATHPQYAYETRAIDCPDSITRIVTFPSGLWRAFDRYTARPKGYYKKTIAFCTDLSVNSKDIYEHTFSDILHYWIAVRLRDEKATAEGRQIIYTMPFNQYAAPDQ